MTSVALNRRKPEIYALIGVDADERAHVNLPRCMFGESVVAEATIDLLHDPEEADLRLLRG